MFTDELVGVMDFGCSVGRGWREENPNKKPHVSIVHNDAEGARLGVVVWTYIDVDTVCVLWGVFETNTTKPAQLRWHAVARLFSKVVSSNKIASIRVSRCT